MDTSSDGATRRPADLTPAGTAFVVVAHRAANSPGGLGRVAGGAVRWVEADVHRHRRRLEVRHEKRLGPLLWDKWYVLTRPPPPVEFHAVVAAAAVAGLNLQVDLKSFSPAFARDVRAALDRRPVLVTSRRWYLLRAFLDRPDTTLGYSANTRLALARLCLSRRQVSGVQEVAVVNRRLLTPAVAARLRARFDGLYVWGVHGEHEYETLGRLGVTGVIVGTRPD